MLVCIMLDERFVIVFFSRFHLCPACRKGLEDKTYQTMDLPVNGESDGELGRGLHSKIMTIYLSACSLFSISSLYK